MLQDRVPVLVYVRRDSRDWGTPNSRSLQVDVLQLHRSRGSDGGHTLTSDSTGIGSDSLGAGDLVGSRVTVLSYVSKFAT